MRDRTRVEETKMGRRIKAETTKKQTNVSSIVAFIYGTTRCSERERENEPFFKEGMPDQHEGSNVKKKKVWEDGF